MKLKPFIHLLQSPYHCYIFDVNTNSIVRVSEELYSYLLAEQKEKDLPLLSQLAQEERIQLIDNGYLNTKHPMKIENSQLDDVDYLLNNSLSMLILQVTQQCNFRCSYCPYTIGDDMTQRRHSNKRMIWDTAKSAIDFFAERVRDSRIISIGFYGGEPLMEWPLVKRTMEYAKHKLEGKALTFGMTTNATLLTEEIAKYFVMEGVNLTISLDGPKEIHDRNRRFASNGEGTFDAVMSRLTELDTVVPGFKNLYTINSVVDPCNSPRCIGDFFNKMGMAMVRPATMDPPPGTMLYYSKEYREQINLSELLAYLNALGIGDESLDIFSVNKLLELKTERERLIPMKELPDKCGHSGPCIPGVKRVFVDVNGDFFPCEKCSETSNTMKIGDINQGFNLDNIRNIMNISQFTKENCKKCWNIFHCSICAARVDVGGKISKESFIPFCMSSKKTTERNFLNLIAMQEVSDMKSLS